MAYNSGDQITSGGVVYTYNGNSWTYVVDKHPKTVTTTATYAGTPTPDLISELGTTLNQDISIIDGSDLLSARLEPITLDIPDLQDTYDWEILSRLAMGAIYANEVQVSY